MKYFHDFLLAKISANSDKPALVSGTVSYTYKELGEKSVFLAKLLKEHNLTNGCKIYCELKPSPFAVSFMIACSLAGCVYIPVSHELPINRKLAIIEIVKPHAVVSDKTESDLLQETDVSYILGRVTNETVIFSRKRTIGYDSDLLEGIAYIIFTSGTTGVPKGIKMSHKAVVAFFESLKGFYTSPSEIIGSTSPLQFDFSLIDIGTALGQGCTLIFVPVLLVHHPKKLSRFIRENDISQLHGVPAIWNSMLSQPEVLNELTTLRRIVFGGEAFQLQALLRIKEYLPAVVIINAFGHSESIACSYQIFEHRFIVSQGALSFGKGMESLKLILLDEDGEKVEIPYKHGELYIEAEFLFEGYIGGTRDDDERLRPSVENKKRLMFKTSDVVYFDEHGYFYYVGRADSQVKVQGNRVELGEVDTILLTSPEIVNAVTLASVHNGITSLISFIQLVKTCTIDNEVVLDRIRSDISSKLPRYMFPSRFIIIDHFPVTVNGKIDKKQLLSLQSSHDCMDTQK